MQLLTPEQVAERLDRHRVLIYRWLAEGRLRGQKYGSSWLISASEVARFKRVEAPRRGSPRATTRGAARKRGSTGR